MADDVISDCVGGDYIIIKIEKNDEIYGAISSKGMGTGNSRRHSNESLECLLCYNLNILVWHHPYRNLEGFKLRIDEKRVFFRKVFGHNFLGSANIIKRTLQWHNRQSGDTFKTFGGSLEFIPLKEYATQIPKSEIEKYMSPIFGVFLPRLLRKFQDQMSYTQLLYWHVYNFRSDFRPEMKS